MKNLVTIKSPAGSLVIPPHKIKKLFRKMFNDGRLFQKMYDEHGSQLAIYTKFKNDTEFFNYCLVKIMKYLAENSHSQGKKKGKSTT